MAASWADTDSPKPESAPRPVMESNVSMRAGLDGPLPDAKAEIHPVSDTWLLLRGLDRRKELLEFRRKTLDHFLRHRG